MSVNLYWRLLEEQRVGGDTSRHRDALVRVFGSYPIKLVSSNESELRAMAATEPPGSVYDTLANLVHQHGIIVLDVQ